VYIGKVINRFPSGRVYAPPSKSLAHRALICAKLAGEGARVLGVMRSTSRSQSQDVWATQFALKKLMELDFVNYFNLKTMDGMDAKPVCTIDCNESGSTLRFMVPVIAALGFEARFTGSERLMERPMTPYQDIVCGFSR
jgi:3-phosphoshikimate 1-carboxyvinyltransferase